MNYWNGTFYQERVIVLRMLNINLYLMGIELLVVTIVTNINDDSDIKELFINIDQLDIFIERNQQSIERNNVIVNFSLFSGYTLD